MAFAAASLPLILGVASAGIGIASAVMSTNAQIQANNYQAMIAERNRQLNEANAQRALQLAAEEQIRQDETTRGLIGQQIAVQSASGLKLGGRSQMLTRKSMRMLGRQDALNVRYAGEVEAFNFRQAAQSNADEVRFLRSANSNALLSGFLDAASAGITGLRSIPPTDLSNLMGARRTTLRFAR